MKGFAPMKSQRILPFVPMFLLLFGAGIASAQLATPPAGDYIYEGGAGSLRVKPNGHFDITTVGSNAHTCTLDGTIVRGKAKLDDTACVVNFTAKGGAIEVGTNGSDDCRQSCGMRASFEGTYTKPSPACTDKAVATTRKTFKRQYDAKDYAAAQATLAPVLGECDKTLGWITEGRIRNDLALTQFKLGDRAACLKTLEPLAEDATRTDQGVKDYYPPADADDILPVVRATRTNLKLCRG
jgi:hypothetical protein